MIMRLSHEKGPNYGKLQRPGLPDWGAPFALFFDTALLVETPKLNEIASAEGKENWSRKSHGKRRLAKIG